MTCGSDLNYEEEMNCVDDKASFLMGGGEALLKTSLSAISVWQHPHSFLQIAKHFQLYLHRGGCH